LNLSLGKKLEWATLSSVLIMSSSQLILFSSILLEKREYAILKLKTWMVKLILSTRWLTKTSCLFARMKRLWDPFRLKCSVRVLQTRSISLMEGSH
jgi:hypothetical protein